MIVVELTLYQYHDKTKYVAMCNYAASYVLHAIYVHK